MFMSLSLVQLIFVFGTILSAGLCLTMSMLAFSSPLRKARPEINAYAVLMMGASMWGLATALMALSTDATIWRVLQSVKILGTYMIPVAWLLLALYISGIMVPRSYVLGLALIPVLGFLALVTNDAHQLYYASQTIITDNVPFPILRVTYGTWGIIMILVLMAITVAGALLLFRTIQQAVASYQERLHYVLFAGIVPFIVEAILLLNADASWALDYTPITILFSGLLLWRVLMRDSFQASALISHALIIDSLPNGVLVLDKQGDIVSGNEKLCLWLGVTSDQLKGTSLKQFIKQYPNLRPVLDRDRPTHKPIVLNNRHLEILRSAMRPTTRSRGDEQTPFMGEVWVFRDVTERVMTERALRINQQRYRALFDNSTDAIFIIDLERKIELANQRAADMLNVELDELIGQDSRRFVKEEENKDSISRLEQLLAGNNVPIYERIFLDAHGREIACEVTLLLVRDSAGNPMHIQTIVRDISERKQNEANMQARLEQLDIMHRMDEEINSTLDLQMVQMVGLDAALRLSQAEAGFIAIVEGEDVRIKHYIGAYEPEAMQVPLRYDVGITGRVLVNQEAELVLDVSLDPDYRADLTTTQALMALPLVSQERLVGMMVLETSHPERFSESNYKFMQVLVTRIAVAIDNARLYDYVREQLDELQRLYEELKDLESIKTDMIRIASHDLKNPLSVISGYVELMHLDKDQLSTEHQDFIGEISKSIQRMQNILQDILSLERMSQQAEMQTIDLTGIVSTATDEYIVQAQRRQQDYKVEITDVTIHLQGNEAQLYEATSNLIGNAIKYTPDEGEIRVDLVIQDDKSVRFTVCDTGYGIPESRQERLFQPFYRAKAEGTEHIEGTGLGLHLVKSIIERHGGTIIFESTYGEGSTFGFHLPADLVDV
jgi:PAS domain S-box-containing protein